MEAVSYAQACDRKEILLFEMAVSHDSTTFPYQRKDLPLHLHKKAIISCHILLREAENLITWQISACKAPKNTLVHHYEQQNNKQQKTRK